MGVCVCVFKAAQKRNLYGPQKTNVRTCVEMRNNLLSFSSFLMCLTRKEEKEKETAIALCTATTNGQLLLLL